MADFKAFWQRFKSGENGGKGQKDRFMLLALVGLLILVAVWPVGGKSGKTSGQTEAKFVNIAPITAKQAILNNSCWFS